MSDQQFEKNVRKQLEELRFHPDAAVWTAVEKRIAGKKKRRRGIVWIPVVLLLIAGGIFTIDRNQKNNTSLRELSTKVTPNEKHVTSAIDPQLKQSESITAQAPGVNPRINDNPNRAATIQSDADSHIEERNTNSSDRKPASGIEQLPHASLNGAAIKKSSSNHSTVFATILPAWKNDQDDTLLSIATFLAPTLPSIADSTGAILTKQFDLPLIGPAPSIVAASPVERRKSTFQWGITIDAGFSNVTEGSFFDVTQKSLVQDVASNSYSSPLPANAVLPTPSDIRPGPAFSAGVFARKAVSKRIALSAGIGYSLLQTYIQVGQYTQANLMVLNARGMMGVASVYRPGNQQHYNNQYHFLEFPFEASIRLNKRKQYPIVLNTGMIAGRLLNSNALHFDGATRVYYEDNSLFNKTQLGFSGGFSIGVLQRTAHPVTAGPFLHYRATSLMKYAVNGERHLLSFGLNIKVLMKK